MTAVLLTASAANLNAFDWNACPSVRMVRHYIFESDSVLVATPWDSEQFKQALVDQLIAGKGKRPEDGFYYSGVDFEDYKYPVLSHSIEFSADSDFVILIYAPAGRRKGPDGRLETSIDGFNRPIVACLIRSTGRVYLMTDGFGAPLVEGYNRMRSENGGMPDLEPLSAATLLIKLAYSYTGGMAIVESWEDVFAWCNVKYSRVRRVAGRDDPDPFPTFFPARIEEIRRASDSLGDCQSREFTRSYVEAVEIAPPSVCTFPDSTVVRLTVFVGWHGWELSSWRVVFSSGGDVLSMRYEHPPGGTLEHSPYCTPDWKYVPPGDTVGCRR
jgi:hypothetical protein